MTLADRARPNDQFYSSQNGQRSWAGLRSQLAGNGISGDRTPRELLPKVLRVVDHIRSGQNSRHLPQIHLTGSSSPPSFPNGFVFKVVSLNPRSMLKGAREKRIALALPVSPFAQLECALLSSFFFGHESSQNHASIANIARKHRTH
jgi:hypothetical protein